MASRRYQPIPDNRERLLTAWTLYAPKNDSRRLLLATVACQDRPAWVAECDRVYLINGAVSEE